MLKVSQFRLTTIDYRLTTIHHSPKPQTKTFPANFADLNLQFSPRVF